MLTTLFVDMNSYFASVEQQAEPKLRGKPVAVSPVIADSGCCIAVSVEAKRFGVRTGTRVREARQLCPDITIVPSRPTLYVETHHAILEAVNTVIPVDQVHSIDEFSCRLMRNERDPTTARRIAQAAKDAIRERVGTTLRSSAGVASNRFIAKVATDIEKPDGLTVIQKHELPGPLLTLELTDLPYIGVRMGRRLNAVGIRTVADLYARSENELRNAWGSIVGARWWYMLRGEAVHEPRIVRRSLGHEHVLEPSRRHDDAALAVLLRLTHKACARLRHEKYVADRVHIGVRPVPAPLEEDAGEHPGRWRAEHRFPMHHADTAEVLCAVRNLWRRKPAGQSQLVSVTLGGLVEQHAAEASLFRDVRRRNDVWSVVDRINARYRDQAVYSGAIHHLRDERIGGIAFQSIPDLDFVDTVGDKMVGGRSHETPNPAARRPKEPAAPPGEDP